MTNEKHFLAGYKIAAAWLATDSKGGEKDARGLPWTRQATAKAESICRAFLRACPQDLEKAAALIPGHPDTGGSPWGSLGADLYLSNAGTGYADRPELGELGRVLSDAAGRISYQPSATVYRGRVSFE